MPKDKFLLERACSQLHIKRRLPKIGETLRVNMNLNRGLLSVKGGEGEHRGKVLMYTAAPLCLEEVEFRVQDAKYEKIQEEGARDVCAYAKGIFRPFYRESDGISTRPISYNPTRQKHFHTRRGIPVRAADELRAWVDTEGKAKMRGTGLLYHDSR